MVGIFSPDLPTTLANSIARFRCRLPPLFTLPTNRRADTSKVTWFPRFLHPKSLPQPYYSDPAQVRYSMEPLRCARLSAAFAVPKRGFHTGGIRGWPDAGTQHSVVLHRLVIFIIDGFGREKHGQRLSITSKPHYIFLHLNWWRIIEPVVE